MDIALRDSFVKAWEKYFPGSELPIACYYSDDLGGIEFPDAPKPNSRGYTCVFSQIASVRRGSPRAFNMDNLGCFGGHLHLGFNTASAEQARHYVCEIERMKKSPAHLDAMLGKYPHAEAPGKYLVFKRWDTLEEQDEPQVVFFLASPDVIAGLHMLANYDTMDPHAVAVPFGSGCNSIVSFPMGELTSEAPKAFIGALDPAVRLCVKPDILSFAAPWPKFVSMMSNMEESFLTADCWSGVRKRVSKND